MSEKKLAAAVGKVFAKVRETGGGKGERPEADIDPSGTSPDPRKIEAILGTELQGVLKALRGAGIDAVAIHQHMTSEQPRMMFLHYWGVGRTDDLARGLRAALDRTSVPGGTRK